MKINIILKYAFSLNYLYQYAKHNNQYFNGFSQFYISSNLFKNKISPQVGAKKHIFEKEDILNLAYLAKNSYTIPNASDWEPIKINLSSTIDPQKDTIKGYIFSDSSETNLIIALKGTDLGILSNQSYNDKFNDNLFYNKNPFKKWDDRYPCESFLKPDENVDENNKQCYKESLNYPINYMKIIDKFYINANKYFHFNKKNVIITGHSLGGTLSTFLGLKYNHLVITYNSPGERHYINYSEAVNKDLIELNQHNIYHYSLISDPISKGNCKIPCHLAGYYLTNKCHFGYKCIYENSIYEDIVHHTLNYMIKVIKRMDLPMCEKIDCKENFIVDLVD